MLRELLLTDAFQRSSLPTASALAKDADNALLSHVRVRRLGGEALRDSLITLSGRMEHRMYGPGDNAMGPPHQQVRRSVYLNIRRNSLNPLITTFDGPKPFTTVGRRDATNVPAQSLTLLNSPFVIDTAKQWARTLNLKKQSDADKVDTLFIQALARKATSGRAGRGGSATSRTSRSRTPTSRRWSGRTSPSRSSTSRSSFISNNMHPLTRRELLRRCSLGFGGIALSGLLSSLPPSAPNPPASARSRPRPRTSSSATCPAASRTSTPSTPRPPSPS